MASFVVPLPCGISWLAGGLFSSEAGRRRIFSLSLVFDANAQKAVFAAADRGARPNPQAGLIPRQLVMQANRAPAPVVGSLAVDREVRSHEAEDKADTDGGASEAQLGAAREKAMADVAATLRALREDVAEQEAADRAAAESFASGGYEDGEAESVAETEWEVVLEVSLEAFPIHANC